MKCDMGVIGLGVMGSNFAFNMERNGFRVAGYDLDTGKAATFVNGSAAAGGVGLLRPDGSRAWHSRSGDPPLARLP